jgi:predicted DNA binding CopG/RHH family protein
MDRTLKIPDLKTEGDEARWWAENQDQLAQQFERAAAGGKLGRGTVAQRGNTPTTTIRLDPEDIARARLYAERKGLKYQTYLKMLIHQALYQEESQNVSVTVPVSKRSSSIRKQTDLNARTLNAGREIRRMHNDTLVSTLRDVYGKEFAEGYRSDTKLTTVLEREGLDNLGQLLKRAKR